MKAYLWLITLAAFAAAIPADDSFALSKREDAYTALMKHDCGDPGCSCTGATGSICFSTCDCATACCEDKSRLCSDLSMVLNDGSFCRGGSSG